MHGDFSHRLHRVGVERNAHFPTAADQRLDRLQDARFIVGEHDADQPRLGRQEFAEVLLVDHARRIDPHTAELKAPPLQLLCRPRDAGMFHRRNDDATGLRARHAQQGQIVRLRTAAGQNDPIRLQPAHVGAQDPSDPFAGFLQDLTRTATMPVGTRGVAVPGQVTVGHDLRHFGVNHGCRIVVQVDDHGLVVIP